MSNMSGLTAKTKHIKKALNALDYTNPESRHEVTEFDGLVTSDQNA